MALAFLTGSQRLGYMEDTTPGPGFFPFWMSLILAGTALILLVQGIRREAAAGTWLPDRPGLLRLIYLGGATIAAVILTPLIGMLAAIGVYMGFLVYVLEKNRWYTILGAAVLTPVGIWLVFAKWLLVPIPTGPFGF